MGVYYSQYLVPAAGAVDYRPDVRVLGALVERLQRLQWIDAAWRTVPLVGVQHSGKAARRSLEQDVGVLRELGDPVVIGPFRSPPPEVFWGSDRVRKDGLSRAYDFREDEDAALLPRYNDEVRIIVADVACLVSTNAYSEAFPDQEQCERCGADLVSQVDELYAADDERQAWFESAGAHRVLPLPCANCGAAVELERLHHLPLFRFALRLDPPPKSTPAADLGAADPELLAALRELTGVEFEMIPSWS